MFRPLLSHPQEALHKRHLVYCVRVVSWLHQDWSGTGVSDTPVPQRKQGTDLRQHNKSATKGELRVNFSEYKYRFSGFLSGPVKNSVLSALVTEKSYRVKR
jgi:hypothetical protein